MYKILIVDDESIEREGISFLIEKYKLPLEVAQATNGKTALEYMRTPPHRHFTYGCKNAADGRLGAGTAHF